MAGKRVRPYNLRQQNLNNGFMTMRTFAHFFLVVVVALLIGLIFRNSQHTIQDLRNSTISDLKKVFKGDVPYVYYCHRDDNGNESPPSYFLNVHNEMRSNVNFALLDCTKKLKSGRTIKEAYKLKQMNPMIFLTSPWGPPVQATRSNIQDSNSFRKFVTEGIKAKSTLVTSTKELLKSCNFNTTIPEEELNPCIVIVKGNQYNVQKHEILEERIIKYYKSMKIVSLDAKIHRLSFENANKVPADHFAMKLHAVKGMRKHLSMIYPLEWDNIQSFMVNAISQPLEGYDDGAVKVIRAPYKSKSKSSKTKSSKTKSSKDENENEEDVKSRRGSKSRHKVKDSDVNDQAKDEIHNENNNIDSTDEEGSLSEEELIQIRINRERERRERMDREAKEFLAEEVEDETDMQLSEELENEDDDNMNDEEIIEI